MQQEMLVKYLADSLNNVAETSIAKQKVTLPSPHSSTNNKKERHGAKSLIFPRSQSAPRRAASDHLPQAPNKVPWTKPGQLRSDSPGPANKPQAQPSSSQPYKPRQASGGGILPRGPRQGTSSAGTNKSWWPPVGVTGAASDATFPTTAVTDKNGPSITSTEFHGWLERMDKLERAVKEERKRRKHFEEELKKLQSETHVKVSSTAAGTAGTGQNKG